MKKRTRSAAMKTVASVVMLGAMFPNTIAASNLTRREPLTNYTVASVKSLDLSLVGDESIGLSDFNNLLTPIYDIFSVTGLDFFNVNFDSFDLSVPGNEHIIQTACNYIPFKQSDDQNSIIIDAESLQTFMKEAYNIDLPLETIGIYAYDKAENTFTYSNSSFINGRRQLILSEITLNSDGSSTAFMDLYEICVAMNGLDESAIDDELKKPIEDWDKNIIYSKIAMPAITFYQNSDYEYFPIHLVSVKSNIYDWVQTEGSYCSSDGAFTMSLRIDNRYADEKDIDRNLSILLTDNARHEDHYLGGYISGNSVMLNDNFSVLSILMTLNSDGSLSVSDAGELIFSDYSLDITGVYTKASDEIHPFPFKVKYSYFNVPGEIDEDAQEEPHDVVSYSIPKITGLGDAEFEEYVNQCITDFITVPALAFEAEYKELLENPEMKEFSTRYGYTSDAYVLTTSKDYYAIAISGYEYRGGAHGMPFIWTFNIGVKEKKLLTLADLFKDKGYKEILEEKLSKLAETDMYQEMMFPDITEVSIYDEENSFYLTSENLVIYFHPYDIGPYAAGFIRFKIPLTELADILNDEYLDAEYFTDIGEYLLFE